MITKIKSKKVKGLTFIVRDISCFYVRKEKEWTPPYCEYKGFCKTKLFYGLRYYCMRELK